MPRVTDEEIRGRRRRAAANLAVGGAMMGGANAAQREVGRRTGVKSVFDAGKQVLRSGKGVEGRHAKYMGAWLGTRGVAAAGVPLVAVGTTNLLKKRPKQVEAPDIKRDVLGESVRRTTHLPKTPLSKVAKTDTAAINTLARNEQKTLINRKRKQSAYSLGSAALGATALGLKSPALAGVIVRRAPKAPKAVHRFAATAPRSDKLATNVGIGSLGVGSVGSLNFARIQRSEAKADTRSSAAMKVKKQHLAGDRDHQVDVAKALLRIKPPALRPPRFAGVKSGGLRRVQTPYGIKTIAVRGSLG